MKRINAPDDSNKFKFKPPGVKDEDKYKKGVKPEFKRKSPGLKEELENILLDQIHQPVGKGYEKNVMDADAPPRTKDEYRYFDRIAQRRLRKKISGRKKHKAKPVRAYNTRGPGPEETRFAPRTKQVRTAHVTPEFKKKWDYDPREDRKQEKAKRRNLYFKRRVEKGKRLKQEK